MLSFIGPFHFSNEITLGNLLTLLGIIWVSFKYLRHFVEDFKRRNERIDALWLRFNGDYAEDPSAWFNRMRKVEDMVLQLWKKMNSLEVSTIGKIE